MGPNVGFEENVELARSVFLILNRRDASRYRDLEAFLPGLGTILKTLKFAKLSNNKRIIFYFNEYKW